MTVLLREAIGDRLRHARTNQRRTLREVSRSARVSLGYLSEVERGRKEASSELLAAICDALELPLSELLHKVASDMGALTSVERGLPERVGVEPVDKIEAMDALEPDGGKRVAVEGGRLLPAVIGENLADLRIQPVLSHRIDPPLTSKARAGAVFAA
ncbi:helix-turn-helix domain-containing protein [Actinokineospora cianjurensis]|uniref:Transcriptional regulator with XRE-family HTH domain n=1 Tax=Actinokineospora cianjurensis TaxID=585224 RepID=A0A421BCT9_9PSEU|nr:helix-turn-helix transcriptional regulator [Actinokineospora cianjurensis]RLK62153.1 transcriptional regulator with XRE-family HTH domain [Actinokineospora cianjurensis]